MKTFKKFLQENAPANVTGSNVAGTVGDPPIKIKPSDTFAGYSVFDVNEDVFVKSIKGKAKGKRYRTYVGEDNMGKQIREYAKQNPKKPIVLRSKTGAMVFLRRGLNESLEMIPLNESEIDERYIKKLSKYLISKLNKNELEIVRDDSDESTVTKNQLFKLIVKIAKILDSKLKLDNKKLNVFDGELDSVLEFANIPNDHGVLSDEISDHLEQKEESNSFLSRKI